MAVLSKLQDQEAVIIDKLDLNDAKTSRMSKILGALNLRGKKDIVGKGYDKRIEGVTCLVGLDKANEKVWLSSRNIQGVAVLPVSEFNALTIMRQKRLVLTRDALEALRKGATATASA
jgi:large subunit ribosomal protein L4